MAKNKHKGGTPKSSAKLTSQRMLKNRPIDAEKDEAEVRPAGVVAAAVDMMEAAGEVEQIEHPALVAEDKDVEMPVAVQNGRLLATYVGLGLERNKENEKLVHLDWTFPLEAACEGFIPKKVAEAWHFLADSGDKAHTCQNLPLVTLDVYLSANEKKSVLHLIGAQFTMAVVKSVEETGKTKVKEVIRFSFRLLVERDDDVINFAAWHDGEQFWIKIPSTQKELGE